MQLGISDLIYDKCSRTHTHTRADNDPSINPPPVPTLGWFSPTPMIKICSSTAYMCMWWCSVGSIQEYGSSMCVDESQSNDSHKLCMVNQQIKATLTELINTESVRSDEKYRSWVLEKLMDAEQQIRKQRRRHSSGDREMAASIATHFSPAYSSTWR